MSNTDRVESKSTFNILETQWLQALNVATDDYVEDGEWLSCEDGDEDSDEDGDESLEEYEAIIVDEKELKNILDESTISKVLDDFGVEATVFREGELEDLKRKEKILMQRQDK